MLYSIGTNFKAVIGVYNNSVYVTTMKTGSMTLVKQMDQSNYTNQDTFLPQLLKHFENPNIDRRINLFIRDPFQSHISGVIQNTLEFKKKDDHQPTFFGRSLVYLNDPQIMHTVDLVRKQHTNWFLNGLPEVYEDLLINLIKAYYENIAVYELYLDPHVQPFLTPINTFLLNNKINFQPLLLEDFNWKMSPAELKEARHSNESFKKVAIEAFHLVKNEVLIDMIKKETATFNHLLSQHKGLDVDYI